MAQYTARPSTTPVAGWEVMARYKSETVESYLAKGCTESEARIIAATLNTGIEALAGGYYVGDDLAVFSSPPSSVVNTYGCTERDLSRLQEIAMKWESAPLWSNIDPPPALGSFVHVLINGIGRACVVGYYIEHGFLGLLVAPVKPPAWYRKQNGGKPAHVVGTEIAPPFPSVKVSRCKACTTRAQRGLDGQCPACANKRARKAG